MPENIIQRKWTSNAALNKALRESKERIAFSECMFGGIEPVTLRKLTEAETTKVCERMKIAEAKGKKPELFRAKVGQADKMNQNYRVYPRGVWQKQIDHFKTLASEGALLGAVDHIGDFDGGNLKDTCIIHRNLEMDETGAVYADFEIVRDHSRGKDLGALADAGAKIGFSTYGYGTGHSPTEAECKMYGIPEDLAGVDREDGGATIMNADYGLKKIDSVDDPSVHDAFMEGREGGGVRENAGQKLAEACANGLHWKELGSCGHVLSECRCDAKGEKHILFKDKLCPRCSKEAVSPDQFKARIRENKPARDKVSESSRAPLAKQYHQYVQSKSGDSFEPAGAMSLSPALTQDCYDIIPTWEGIRFVRKPILTDDLYRFPNSVMETVIAEIDKFYDLKAKYDDLGVLHNRGIAMEGPPGMGKTSCLNLVNEMMIARGDVVFYAKNIGTLIEALRAFRDVEPERRVLVNLEDADGYLGYQEREFLNLLDGAESISGVLYLATTNYINRFPERMLRSGRFDKVIHVGPPPIEGRRAFLAKKLEKFKETKETVESLAAETEGLSFGDLRELVIAIYALGEAKSTVLSRLKKKVKGRESLVARLEPQTEGTAVTESARPPQQDQGVREDTNQGVDEMDLQKQLEAAQAQNKALVAAIKPLVGNLKEVAGVELPVREVLPGEIAERITKLEGEVAAARAESTKVAGEHKAALEAKDAKIKELEGKLAEAAAKDATAERVTKIKAKALPLLKDNVYAPALKAALAEKLSDPSFDDTKVEGFIESKSKEYDLISGGRRPAKPSKKAKEAAAPQRPENGFNANAADFDEAELAGLDEDDATLESNDEETPVSAELAAWCRPVAENAPRRPRQQEQAAADEFDDMN